MRAETALNMGYADEAASLTQDILNEDSSHLGALETFAKSQWRAGRFEHVIRTTDKLLSLNPYEPGYHALRGAALQALGRYGEAVDAYDRSKQLPNSAEALKELQIWQAGLLSELLASDPVFRASYRQDPEKACEAKGFRFLNTEETNGFLPVANNGWSYLRPS